MTHEMWPRPTDPYEASVAREQYEANLHRNAKKVCTAIFLQGRDPREYVKNDLLDYRVQYFDYQDVDIEVDEDDKLVTFRTPSFPPKRVKYHEGYGSTMLPNGAKDVSFDYVDKDPKLPDADSQDWPLGDKNATSDPPDVDYEALEETMDWAFEETDTDADSDYPETRALLVVYDGKIIAEKYADPFDEETPWMCWSMGKAIISTLIGILIHRGHFNADSPAPVDEWYRDENDPRQDITIADLLHMSSGLRYNKSDQEGTIHMTRNDDHQRGHTSPIDIHEYSVNQPLQHEPGTQYAYRNVNPYVLGKIARDTVESEGQNYLQFPQRALYDKIGVRNAVHEPDPYGNYIFSGFNLLTARDWARIALLYLQRGTVAGNRVFSEDWTDFVQSPSAANEHYSSMFRLNRDRFDQMPEDTYWAHGAQSNRCYIIPSRDVAVVRLGREAAYDLHDLTGKILDSIDGDGRA